MTSQELAQTALARARSCRSLGNMVTVVSEFAQRGIPESEITPGENVLTFHAWRALGRHVKRGEHGVKVTTWIHATKQTTKADGTTREEEYSYPRSATVFHITQTEEN